MEASVVQVHAADEKPPQLTKEMMDRINSNRIAALERKRLREQAEKELSRPEEEKAIKLHLKTANRPFNANNLIDEFASKFKRSVIVKALQTLVIFLSLKSEFLFQSSNLEFIYGAGRLEGNSGENVQEGQNISSGPEAIPYSE